MIWAHCQSLPGGASVLAAPGSGAQVRSAAATLAGLLARLGELDADVLIDAGRLGPGSSPPLFAPAGPASASRVVWTSRARLADLNALAGVLEHSSDAGGVLVAGQLGLVVVGDGPYPDTEIAEALGVAVLGRLPWEPGAAELLGVVPASDRRLRLSPLVRSARSLAETLAPEPAPVPAAVAAAAPNVAARLRVRLGHPVRAPATAPPGDYVATNGSLPGGGTPR